MPVDKTNRKKCKPAQKSYVMSNRSATNKAKKLAKAQKRLDRLQERKND